MNFTGGVLLFLMIALSNNSCWGGGGITFYVNDTAYKISMGKK